MEIAFTASAHRDYLFWKRRDVKKYERIRKLCRDILKNPFDDIGKSEPLKYNLQGCWSRRIDSTHRLVYRVEKRRIIVISCRYHY